MDRKDDQPLKASEPGFGTVWRVHNPDDVWKMITEEGGYVYQAHPRTKGSMGFPDQIRDSEQFLDPRYFGTGWKAMNSDLSLPHLSARGFLDHPTIETRKQHPAFLRSGCCAGQHNPQRLPGAAG